MVKASRKLKKDDQINWILALNIETGEYVPPVPKLSFWFRVKRKFKHIAKKILRRQ